MAVYELRLQQRLHNQLVLNTFHFTPAGVDQGSQSLAEQFDAFVTSDFRTRASSELLLESITVVPKVPYGAAGFTMPTTQSTGLNNTPAAPGAIACVVSLRSAFLGRSKNGRVFLAGHPRNNIDQGVWTAAQITSVSQMMAVLLGIFGTNGSSPDWRIGIWSEKLGGVGPAATDAGFAYIVGARVNAIPGSLRRRKIGVGS